MGLVGNRWDRWERGEHRVRAYWYGQPFIHGTAHPGTEFLTQGRSEVFRDITREHLDGHAFPYIVRNSEEPPLHVRKLLTSATGPNANDQLSMGREL